MSSNIHEIECAKKRLVNEWWKSYKANARLAEEAEKLGESIDRLVKSYEESQRLFKVIAGMARYGKRPKYYRTGITPKWSNRTRKKQRLTRLQRRWKRQRR